MKRLNLILLAFAICAFPGCRKDYDPYALPENGFVAANMDIGDVRALYRGESLHVYNDVVIGGYVTANDRSGNFYRSFMIEDPTGAIEIKAGAYDLGNYYVPGRYVAVRAKGLTIGAYNGVLEIGNAPVASSGGYQTDYFGHRAELERYVFAADDFSEVAPSVYGIEELEEDLCGRLVTIEGVTLVKDVGETGSVTWAFPPVGIGGSAQTGYRIFVDAGDNELCVVTSGYADFAGEAVTESEVSLTGILSRGRSGTGRTMWLLKLRGLDDVEAE